MELLRIKRQIHCKAVEQRATLIHRQYNRDWGTSYSRPPIDPYPTSPRCYKILAAPLVTRDASANRRLLACRPWPRSSRPQACRLVASFHKYPYTLTTYIRGWRRGVVVSILYSSLLYISTGACGWVGGCAVLRCAVGMGIPMGMGMG